MSCLLGGHRGGGAGEVNPSFSIQSRGGPLGGGRHHGPLRAEPVTSVSEQSPMGERLKRLKQSATNSRLPKQLVLLWEKPPHNKRSPSTATASTDDGTIRTPRGKAHYKSPFLAWQILVFFTSARYMVVKIACSCSELVL
jgi:hypothetical protein